MTAAEAPIRVRFDATLDDFVDATQRLTARSRLMKGWRWKDTAIAGVFGLILFFATTGGSFSTRLTWGLIGGAGTAAFYRPIQSVMLKRRLRQYFREQLKTAGPVPIEIEVGASGVSTWQLGAQATYGWESVEAIVDTPDSIDIFTKSGGTIVRNRAFRSGAERGEFLALARRYHNGRAQTPTG